MGDMRYKIIGISVYLSKDANWNLARRAGGQVVRRICVIVLSLRRSVSFFDATNWNLQVICNANVGADAERGKGSPV